MFRNSPLRRADGYSGFGARKYTFKKVVKKVMRDRWMNQIMVQMENTIRKVVREELDRLLQPFLASVEGSQSSASAPIERSRPETPRPRFELRFINSLPPEIFTGARIEADGPSPIQIELVDAATNSRVVTGPLSSSRLEIVALNGDFSAESWDAEEFSRNILRQRDGKRPLISGDLFVTLKNGVGVIDGDVFLTDNSSWTRSRKFRIGVRAVRGGVLEARSEPVVCKDQRGEPYKKHHPPFPGDKVWRLEKIAKDGVFASRLAKHEIHTVKDFRRRLAKNPDSLRQIVDAGTTKKTWEKIVAHAMRCVLDETEYYIYNSVSHGASLLLNSVYEVVKVSFDSVTFLNLDHLSFEQKIILDELKREAYGSTNSFTQVNGQAYFEPPPRSLPCPQDMGLISLAGPVSHHLDFQGNLTHFDASAQPEMLLSFENYSTPPTFQLNDQFSHFISSAMRNSFRTRETDPVQDGSEIDQMGQVENPNHPHVMTMHWSPGSTSWAQQAYNEILHIPRMDELGQFGVYSDFDIRIARIIRSPRARWCKIRAALKFREVYTAARNGRRVYNL